jgi:hypothetical protein
MASSRIIIFFPFISLENIISISTRLYNSVLKKQITAKLGVASHVEGRIYFWSPVTVCEPLDVSSVSVQ